MNRKQRKRKLQRAKAHQAQSKNPSNKMQHPLLRSIPKKQLSKFRDDANKLVEERPPAKAPLKHHIAWFYAVRQRLFAFWRLINGSSTTVK